MIPGPQPPFAPNNRAHERALQKEREHTFHRQRLSDYAARKTRKSGPIRSELKFHWNASDDAHGKVESEYLGPKPHSFLVPFVACPQGTPFPRRQEPRQSHGELRKQVVVG